MDPTFQQLAVATLLGLLVGLQREHVAGGIAGMRTFPLITLFGALSAMLAMRFGDSWPVAAGLLGVLGVAALGHLFRSRHDGARHDGDCPTNQTATQGDSPIFADTKIGTVPDSHPGTTTDVAMLLMFAVGALVVVGPMAAAVAVGGGVAVLLQFKPELHGIAKRLGDEDLRAIMQFVLITCIILPVLPDRNYGPADWYPTHAAVANQPPDPLAVFNPYWTWLMVVLIVGLSLGGYIVYKFFGRDAGILLGGVLGGAVSSTATTVSYARSARSETAAARAAAVVIMIASTVMYVRILAAVAVVSGKFFLSILPSMGVLMLLTLLPAIVLWLCVRHRPAPMPEQKNPTQLVSAVVFGVLYAVVLMALAVAKQYGNGRGMYAVAFLSGLTEMDAVTLSTARMFSDSALAADVGWRMIVVAALANLVSKAAIAGLLGGWRFLVRIVLLFAVPMLGGIVMLMLKF
jgi:uncharacterized membrane protein (DUF4010 family)